MSSRRQKLVETIAEIDGQHRATEREAARVVELLMCSYPQQQARNPEVYTSMLIMSMTGFDLDILKEMINPRRGLRSKFLPTTAEVVDWLDKRLKERQRDRDRAQRELDQIDGRASEEAWVPPTEEEKARRTAKWQEVRKGFVSAGEAARKVLPRGGGTAAGELVEQTGETPAADLPESL